MKHKTYALILCGIALVIGGLIYLGARPLYLNMFHWAGLGENTGWLKILRDAFPKSTPEWIVYALPDGLWSFAYTLAVSVIWDFDFRRGWMMIILIPLIGIISELMQLFDLLQGVFDYGDLIAYSGGFAIGLLVSYRFGYKIYKFKLKNDDTK